MKEYINSNKISVPEESKASEPVKVNISSKKVTQTTSEEEKLTEFPNTEEVKK